MYVLSGSIRTVAAAKAAEIVWPVARRMGVSRVAETTWLDRIGLPVVTAIRPDSELVVVTAGKGSTVDEARVGALMEAIEQAVAERAGPVTAVRWASARDISREGGPRLGSWCPRPQVYEVDVDEPLPWVDTVDPIDAAPIPVPAELVLSPCPPGATTGLFGSTTTGLASGLTDDEAVLHGLCEVLERDTTSLMAARDTSALIDAATLPAELAAIHEAIVDAGLHVWLRWAQGPGGHYMSCVIADPERPHPLYCNAGYGFHPLPRIAASRALTEAAQSRLGYIQGSRDDLTASYVEFATMSETELAGYTDVLLARASSKRRRVAFDDLHDADAASPRELLVELVDAVAAGGLGPIGVHRFPPWAAPCHVVRVVVGGAEHHTSGTRRVGARLAAHSYGGVS